MDLLESLKSHATVVADTGDQRARLEAGMDKRMVNFECEILTIVPGRVSIEVDAALSFDTEGTVDKTHRLIALHEAADIARERVLTKVAITWEGIRAAERLEREGIHCNRSPASTITSRTLATGLW